MPKKLYQISYQEVLAVIGILGVLAGWFATTFTQNGVFTKFQCNSLRRDMFLLSSSSRKLKSHVESNMVGRNSTDPLVYIEFLSSEIQGIENQIDELQYKLKNLNC